MIDYIRLTFLLIILLVVTVACRQEQGVSVENIDMVIDVTDNLVGETTLIVTITDENGNAIENISTLTLRGDMNHAGMVPVIRESSEANAGVFMVPFEWTMGGSWTVTATLTLSNGDIVTESFDYEILTEATEQSTDDMNHSVMTGETSAVYLTISNNGDTAVTIIGASSSAAGLAELHETVIENDIASMSLIETVVIEAGETIEFAPAGKHIMLMQLTQDLAIGDAIELSLHLESGDDIPLTALIQDMLMDDLSTTVEVGDLLISNVWARPASMGIMDMEESEVSN